MEDVTKARQVEVPDYLLKAHLDADGKVLAAKLCTDAYEQGLQDGLATKIAGPDA